MTTKPVTSDLERTRIKLKSTTNLMIVVAMVFTLILGAWVVLGSWESNLRLFGSTVVLFTAMLIALLTLRAKLSSDLKKFESEHSLASDGREFWCGCS